MPVDVKLVNACLLLIQSNTGIYTQFCKYSSAFKMDPFDNLHSLKQMASKIPKEVHTNNMNTQKADRALSIHSQLPSRQLILDQMHVSSEEQQNFQRLNKSINGHC